MVSRKNPATPATRLLDEAAVVWTGHSYTHDPAAASYGLEAASALGVDPARVFKTLLVIADDDLAVAVVPVDRMVDLKAVATALGAKKAAMAEPKAAERSTGYVVGGISPLAQKRSLATVIDDSAREHETVLVSGGRRGFDVELPWQDLVTLTSAHLAAIAR